MNISTTPLLGPLTGDNIGSRFENYEKTKSLR